MGGRGGALGRPTFEPRPQQDTCTYELCDFMRSHVDIHVVFRSPTWRDVVGVEGSESGAEV